VYTNNHKPVFTFFCLPERCGSEALLRRVLYCGHSTQYSHLVAFIIIFCLLLQSCHLFQLTPTLARTTIERVRFIIQIVDRERDRAATERAQAAELLQRESERAAAEAE